MLTLHLLHRYSKLPLGFDPNTDRTRLLNYAVAPRLSREFQAYNSEHYAPGSLGGPIHALHEPLPPGGPFLLLFLRTEASLRLAGCHHWAHATAPWPRLTQHCGLCRHQIDHGGVCGGAPGSPLELPCWGPVVFSKYRRARGREVRVMIADEA